MGRVHQILAIYLDVGHVRQIHALRKIIRVGHVRLSLYDATPQNV